MHCVSENYGGGNKNLNWIWCFNVHILSVTQLDYFLTKNDMNYFLIKVGSSSIFSILRGLLTTK